MRHRRSHTRARSTGEEIGMTTDQDPTSTWNTLDLETQAQLAWLEHTIVTKGPVPLPPVSRATFAKAFIIAGLSYLRTSVLRSGVHRRKPRP